LEELKESELDTVVIEVYKVEIKQEGHVPWPGRRST
jgi:hypothetical protein